MSSLPQTTALSQHILHVSRFELRTVFILKLKFFIGKMEMFKKSTMKFYNIGFKPEYHQNSKFGPKTNKMLVSVLKFDNLLDMVIFLEFLPRNGSIFGRI